MYICLFSLWDLMCVQNCDHTLNHFFFFFFSKRLVIFLVDFCPHKWYFWEISLQIIPITITKKSTILVIHDKVYNDLIAFNLSVCIGVWKISNQRKLFMSLMFKQLFTHNEVTFCWNIARVENKLQSHNW